MMPLPKVVAPMLLLAALSCCVGVSAAGDAAGREASAKSRGEPQPGTAGVAVSACDVPETIEQVLLNWRMELVCLGAQRYRIEMRKNRIAAGGEGEAMPLFMRRAEAILLRQGGSSYRILSFAEGLDSSLPLPQRVAQGVVEIIP